MIIALDDPGPPLTEDDISNFESELGKRLPDQYRRFLLQSNGGLPTPDVVDIEGMPGGSADVQVFFRIGGLVESSELRWNKREFPDRIPDRMLPIARDSGGHWFCISLDGADVGNVIYVDFEPEQPNHYFVAINFESFLNKIRSFD